MLNWALVKSPVNWVTIFLMIVIGMIALNLVLTPWHSVQAGTAGTLSPNSTPATLQNSQ